MEPGFFSHTIPGDVLLRVIFWDGQWSPRKALQEQMEALANKETAAKEKEEKQKQAVEDREKRRHQSGRDPRSQETELPR